MQKLWPYIGIAVAVGVGVAFAPAIGFLCLAAVAVLAVRAIGRWRYWPFVLLGAALIPAIRAPKSPLGQWGIIIAVAILAPVAWSWVAPWCARAAARADRYFNGMSGHSE